jgi:hypothetical protein
MKGMLGWAARSIWLEPEVDRLMAGWWENAPDQIYWLENTDREDLGTNLKAPQTDDTGKANWRYALLRELKQGDVVYHFHKPEGAIVALCSGTACTRGRDRVGRPRHDCARKGGHAISTTRPLGRDD